MNKTIRRASVFCLLTVLALLVRVTWVQAYEGKALADDEHNRRNTIAQYAQPLGDIIVAGSPVTGYAAISPPARGCSRPPACSSSEPSACSRSSAPWSTPSRTDGR